MNFRWSYREKALTEGFSRENGFRKAKVYGMASSSIPISQAGGTGYSPFPDSRVSKADIVLFPLRKQPVPGPRRISAYCPATEA